MPPTWSLRSLAAAPWGILLCAAVSGIPPGAAAGGLPEWHAKTTRMLDGPAPAVDPAAEMRVAPGFLPAQPGRSRAGRLLATASSGGTAHLRPEVPADWQVSWNERNGTPVCITGSDLLPRAKRAATRSMAQAAVDLVAAHASIFGLDDPQHELEPQQVVQDALGSQHVVLHQSYAGVPVWGHEVVVHFDRDGRLYAANARYGPTPRHLSTAPRVDGAAAMRASLAEVAARVPVTPLAPAMAQLLHYTGPQAEQVVWVDEETQEPHLAWHVLIRPNLVDRWTCFVDAATGRVLQAYNATPDNGAATASATDLDGVSVPLHVYQQDGRYYLLDASRPIFVASQTDILNNPQGVLATMTAGGHDLTQTTQVTEVSSADNTWTDPAAASAHYHAGVVFDYYLDTHHRRGIDGKGGNSISVVHVTDKGASMGNAYWNGAVVVFGDGDAQFRPVAAALDVAAHETTHGVIENTVNLEYQYQSGALNESLADVFGAMVDTLNWTMGEDVVKKSAFPSGALRNMADPHNGAVRGSPQWQPAKMSEFVSAGIGQDNGAVHANSGIPNHACYLVARAIGRTKTAQIYYRTLEAHYLNTQATFVDMRLAAARAAEDLYGSGSAEVAAVNAAFDSVGVSGTGSQSPSDLPAVQGHEWVALVPAAGTDHSLYLAPPTDAPTAGLVHLTSTQVLASSSRPISVSGDGSVLYFIDTRNYVRGIRTDGTGEQVVSSTGQWRSIALSPDGTRLAAATVRKDSTLYIFDLKNPTASKSIHLYSPTTQEGVSSQVTQYADALQWDKSGTSVLYDAFNSIAQTNGRSIDYWDVNRLDVDHELIYHLFPAQPEGISMGNPSYGQTNDNYVVYDLVNLSQNTGQVWAADLFLGTAHLIEDNGSSVGSWPRYSPDDTHIIFQRMENGTPSLRTIPVSEAHVVPTASSSPFLTGAERPLWFAIGTRSTDVEGGDDAVLPSAYALGPNYPNPFNPHTVIPYDLPQSGPVELVVYDLLGQEVARLETGVHPAGHHVASWDGRDQAGRAVASGVYVCRLRATGAAGSHVETTLPMVLLR